jgi:predicted DNA-binding antitoxin AbrB/MazE fold protein
MEQIINAIYENGVLRPLTPVDLPEHSEVEIAIRSTTPDESATHRRKAEAALIGAGLLQPQLATSMTRSPLSPERREELARRFAKGGPLSEIIIEEREGR